MSKIRKYMVQEAFKHETPTKAMFKIVEEPMPKLRNNECLVKAEYISVDPYMRAFASGQQVPYLQFGFQVGKVIESNNKEYPVNTYVVSHSGWCDYTVIDGSPDEMFNMKPYTPDIGALSLSLAVGALGMPGITAYLGFLEICKPQKEETVCVTSACGAVGSLVGQIAKIKGCTVIGITGTDEKVKILTDDFGFDYAFNYKKEKNLTEAIKTTVVKTIDCYFDNVGGEISNQIMSCLSKKARVAICGAISTYEKESGPASRTRSKSSFDAKVEAFSFSQWEWKTQREALKQIRQWIEKGNIKVKETITEGFEKLPDAFIAMLKGENIGKAVVKV
ncbi:zinc-binding dehydrogenase domain-containing protein [Phthorimaea operculella]|nr:zinc-binding dehydrogenase domain-containing protein [Phthorimaea operculella]